MEPRQARRGTAAVASSTLVVGVLLVVLAFVLSACGGSSGGTPDRSGAPSPAASPSPVTSSPPTGSAPSTTGAPGTGSSSPAPAVSTPAADTTQPPVALDQTATFAAGLTATVISIEPVTATAALPGEIAGPAVRLTLAVQNGSGAAVDLGNVTVDLQDAQASSTTPLSANGSQPFSGPLAPGASATGIYVFSLATDDRAGVTLYVTASASLPVVVFTGDLS